MSALAILAVAIVAAAVASVRTAQLRSDRYGAPAYVGRHRGSAS